MPPKGGNADLTDDEVHRAGVYLANQAGAGWKEPAPTATASATPTTPAATPIATTDKSAAAGPTGPTAPGSSETKAATAAVAAETPASIAPRIATGMETLTRPRSPA